jgi:hypothetical protein
MEEKNITKSDEEKDLGISFFCIAVMGVLGT